MTEKDSQAARRSRPFFRPCSSSPSVRRRAGFGIAPILYMLGLVGVGAGVLFSGYSQILRSNVQMTNDMTTKGDLNANATTLAATSTLSADTTLLCPPQGGSASAECASSTVKMAAISGQAQLPANASSAGSSGSPAEVGVFTAGSGLKQMDGYGHYYIYCRWENPTSPGSDPAFMILSAGPDGSLNTRCGDASAQGDDIILSWPVMTAVNRSAVWQATVSGGNTTSVQFGQVGSQLVVDSSGNLLVRGTLDVQGTSTLAAVSTGAISAASGAFSGALSAGASTLNSAAVTTNATVGGTLGVTGDATFGGAVAGGAGTFSSLGVTNNATVGGTFGVTGNTTLGGTLSAGASTLSSATITNNAAVGGTLGVTGDATFGGAVAGGAGTFDSLGVTTNAIVGGTLEAGASTLSSAAIGSNATVGGTLGVTGTSTFGGAMSGSGATFSGTVTAANFSGPLTGNATNVSGVVAISNGGTGATTAPTARSNLGANDAANLTTGVLDTNRFATNSIPGSAIQDGTVGPLQLESTTVTPGSYNWGTVDADGRLTYATNVSTNVLSDGNGQTVTLNNDGITFTTGGVDQAILDENGYLGLGTTVPNERLDLVGNIRIEGAAGTSREIQFTTGATSKRWVVSTNSAAEGGSDAGSNFTIQSFHDNGTALGTPLSIERSTGNATFGGTVTAGTFVGNLTGNVTGTISGGITLGTQAANTNPQRSGDLTTGFFTSGANTVNVAAGGIEVMRWNTMASGVDYVSVTPGKSGTNVKLAVAGATSNQTLDLAPAGTGNVNIVTGALHLGGLNGIWQDEVNANIAVGDTGMPGSLSQAGGGNNGKYNTAVGFQTLSVNSTGGVNTAIGAAALGSNTTGQGNTALGAGAMQGNTEGYGNTAVGFVSLFTNTTGYENTAIGTQALQLNTTGILNTAVGNQALGANTEGNYNTAVGGLALASNTTGINNTAVGLQVLYFNTEGVNNTGLGFSALNNNTTGSYNTAVGHYALNANSTGVYNTAIGINSLFQLTTGANNTAIGSGALANNASGVGNIGIGSDAGGANEDGSYNVSIGYGVGSQTLTSGSNNILIGTTDAVDAADGTNYNLNIGNLLQGDMTNSDATHNKTLYLQSTASGVNYLQIAGAAAGAAPVFSAQGSDTDISMTFTPKGAGILTMNATTALTLPGGTTGQQPASPADGMIRYNSDTPAVEAYIDGSWEELLTSAAPGGTTVLGTSTSDTNPQRSGDATTGFFTSGANTVNVAAGGIEAMRWNTIASGVDYLSITPGKSGTAVTLAAAGATSTQHLNFAPVGAAGVLQFNGSTMFWQDATNFNTIVGLSGAPATISQTGGGFNGRLDTAVGYQALNANTTGFFNTAVGGNALQSNTIGTSNTAVGTSALAANTTGAGNAAFGTSALVANTTGVANIGIGFQGGSKITTGTNNVAIGYQVASTTLATGANNILVGTSSAVDTAAAGTNYNLNVGNLLQGDMTNSTGTYNKTLYLQSTASGVNYLQVAGAAAGAAPVLSAQGSDTDISMTFTPKGAGILTMSATTALTLPGGTTGQRPTAANGMVRYNSTLTGMEAYYNSTWNSLLSSNSTLSNNLTLGTSASAANPQRSGDATTGFYTSGANIVNVAAGGIEAMRWNTIASGVDYVDITPGKSGTYPKIAAAGATATQGLNLATAGTTSTLQFNGRNMFWSDGAANTIVGQSAGSGTISQAGGGFNGLWNTALGSSALNANTTGTSNTAVGASAMKDSATSGNSTAIGSFALFVTTGASANTALGAQALRNTTTGASNTAAGASALIGNTTGAFNTALGMEALKTNTTGTNNVGIGYRVGSTTLATGTNNILIGTSSATDTYSASTTTAIGIGTGVKPGTIDIAIGYQALAATAADSSGNIAVGYQAMNANTTGYGNIGIGTIALTANTTGADNTALGVWALKTNSTGIRNVAVGNEALAFTTGSRNTAVGYDSLKSNTTGADNTAVGHFALVSNSTGASNTGIGVSSGSSITTGTNNVAIGYGVASSTLTTGGNNILIGTSNAVTTAAAGTNYNLNIGNLLQGDMTNSTGTYNKTLYLQSTASGVNYLQVAGAATTAHPALSAQGSDSNIGIVLTPKGTGGVGIGTTAPGNKLHVYSSASGQTVPALIETTATNAFSELSLKTASRTYNISTGGSATGAPYASNLYIWDGTAAAVRVVMNTSGALSIGPSAPTTGTALDVSAHTSSVLLPVGTTGTRPTGVAGMIRYNSTTPAIEAYYNSTWNSLGTGGGSSTIDLGTSASAANPRRSGDATTGFFSSGANTVNVAAGGIEVERWNTIASGVDYLSITPGKSGTAVKLAVGGATATQHMNFAPVGSAGVLQFNGGTMFWQDTTNANTVVGSASTLPSITTNLGILSGVWNIAIGTGALASITGPGVGLLSSSNNVALGANALNGNTSGALNTAIGSTALSGNTTGILNTAIGYSAMSSATTGHRNTAVGASAQASTTGTYNTAVGFQASAGGTTYSVALGADASTTGSYSTVVGAAATIGSGNYNTAVGYNALDASTTGANNTAVGSAALDANTTGTYNVALGYDALGAVTTGSNNVAIGPSVSSIVLTTGSNNILIGTTALVDTPASSTSYHLNIGNLLLGDMTNSTSTAGRTLYLQSTASGVNYVQIAGATTGNGPTISAIGSDSNIDINIAPKGTGKITMNTTGAMLLPTGTTGQRPGSPSDGMVRYNSTVPTMEVYYSSTWNQIGAAGTPAAHNHTSTAEGGFYRWVGYCGNGSDYTTASFGVTYDVTGCESASLPAGTVWGFRILGTIVSSNTATWKLAMTAATATAVESGFSSLSGSGVDASNVLSGSGSFTGNLGGTTNNYTIQIMGYVSMNTAGTLKLQIQKNTSGTMTVKKNTIMEVWRIS
ncbi:MAG: hypothetical protein SFW62_07265 [Alphaproteobacteria bacterium]|nr:hypothetical protein [Alphaproteobacteria bacterium]